MSDDHSRAGMFERLAGRAQSAAGHLRIRSALNPMLWLSAIVSLPCFSLAYLTRLAELRDLGNLFFAVGALPIVGTFCGFFYFMITAPEKLQSEDYQLRHEAMEFIKQKGSAVELTASSLEAIANPAASSATRIG